MDQMVKPAPAPISASVTLPRVLLKNELGVLGVAAGGCCCVAAAGADARSCRLAVDRRVSFEPAFAASSLAAQGAATAPSATVAHKAMAAARRINRLTCTSSDSLGTRLSV